MNAVKISWLIFITVWLFACEKKHMYSEYQDIPKLKWSSADTLSYTFDIPENTKGQLAISARHRKDYEFSNLWLKVILKGNQRDTVFRFEMMLFNPEGRPYGESSGSTCTQTIPLKKLNPLAKGHYEIQLVQLMRKDPLEGIQDVGVIIDAQP